MTALEYMERQLNKHRMNLVRETDRGAPEEMLCNIREKIGHYEAAISAMRERDILFEQVSGYCHTCKKNKTDFDCHAKCYGHQRGTAWEWDGGRRLDGDSDV